jgi:hypothetical protein
MWHSGKLLITSLIFLMPNSKRKVDTFQKNFKLQEKVKSYTPASIRSERFTVTGLCQKIHCTDAKEYIPFFSLAFLADNANYATFLGSIPASSV